MTQNTRLAPLPHPTRILIVDDHPLMRESLTLLFDYEPGLQVVGSADSVETAKAALIATPADLVVVDIRLRESSGLTLLQDLESAEHPVRTMVVSMHEEPSVMEAAYRSGARAYVSKAESPEAIARVAKQVIAGELVVAPGLLDNIQKGRPADSMAERIAQLSDREREVFVRMGSGKATRDIATELGIGFKTVQTFCGRIKTKLNLATSSEVISEAARFQEQTAGGRLVGV